MKKLLYPVSAMALALGAAGAMAQSGNDIDEDVCEVFEIADLNDDARLHQAEYLEYYMEMPKLDPSRVAGPMYYGDAMLDNREAGTRAFDRIDTNNDGFISVEEFSNRIDRAELGYYGERLAETNEQEMEYALDELSEKDEKISLYDEKDNAISEGRLFKLMDTNDDGELTQSEVRAYMNINTYGCDVSGLRQIKWATADGDDMTVFIEDLDENEDQTITLEEYEEYQKSGRGE
ncbi:MAG: EF-hand domain-containing protein [Rhodothalassiaceae bacterium]